MYIQRSVPRRRSVAKVYAEIACQEVIVDMQLVMNPYLHDVIVTTDLLGVILSNLCVGLVGSLGLAPGASIGNEVPILETVHGSAPDIRWQEDGYVPVMY